MIKLEGYMAGVNLGHWLSQYGNKSVEHFNNYIKKEDIKRIKDLSFDHVRLPVDYFLFENDNKPNVYSEDGLYHIDKCLKWCKEYGVNVILDLHHAPGFFFGSSAEENTLMKSGGESQKRFLDIWEMFAIRYKGYKDELIFELLNELVWEDSTPWNNLWPKAVEVIRKISKNRKIIIGGNRNNHIEELKNLNISDDENVIYTFHMYEPFIFTHQRANWMDFTRNYTEQVKYPVDALEHKKFYTDGIPKLLEKHNPAGIEYIEEFIKPAIDFINKTNKPLYCGEYGVINNADLESTIKWHNDVSNILLKYGIGRAVWSYRGFALVTDNDNNIISDKLIEAISKH